MRGDHDARFVVGGRRVYCFRFCDILSMSVSKGPDLHALFAAGVFAPAEICRHRKTPVGRSNHFMRVAGYHQFT